MQKQRCRSAVQLISAFVFATQIVQSLFFQRPKFPASSHLLCLYSLVCVGPGRKNPEDRFSQVAAHINLESSDTRFFPIISQTNWATIFEPRHEKNQIFAYAKNKGADQLHSYCTADQCLRFGYMDSTS